MKKQKEIENKALVYIKYNEKTCIGGLLIHRSQHNVLSRSKDVATNALHIQPFIIMKRRSTQILVFVFFCGLLQTIQRVSYINRYTYNVN